ncbi:hypothetical protein LSH36_834g02051 [Paralvinella palmiformis]|uniref:EF-hand domain-containing protein n=1 Tax=Paralvinella palmiformis TaxID=53620 RepID=A0AAD9IZL9_9ANNE|nr:hypothetical protein LSH36_834g02051 [Paralvinella palmiformis]
MSYTKEDIIAVFKAFDADNSGQVSNKELVTVLTKLFKDDADKAKSAAEFLMKSFDKDHSGQLSQDEFVTGIQKFIAQ